MIWEAKKKKGNLESFWIDLKKIVYKLKIKSQLEMTFKSKTKVKASLFLVFDLF